MTIEEFREKYRPQLLGILSECFAARNCTPSDFGRYVDERFRNATGILDSMYYALKGKPDAPKPPAKPVPQPVVNGAFKQPQTQRT